LEYVAGSRAQRIEELQNQVESLRDLSGGRNGGGAIGNLIAIVSDASASPRQRLKAAGVLVGYRVQDPAVHEFAKAFLEHLSASAENFDYRIEASEILRRCEDIKLSPAVARPDYTPPRTDTAEEIAERHERHLAHIERQAEINARELAEEQQRFASQRPRST
jgi:hypothetical protein